MFAKLDESTELLKKRKQENRTEKIFEELLDELIPLLHYFKLASKSLEPFNTPTLHLVDMWLAKLKAHLQPRDEPITVNGAHGKKMTIPADSESIAPINVATPLWPSVGVKPNTWKSWRLGVFRDSRMFRARQRGEKHLALGCSWCHWKGLET